MGTCKGVNGSINDLVGDVTVVRLERWRGGQGNRAQEISRLYISDEGHVAVDQGWGPDPIGQIATKPGMQNWTLVYLALLMWGLEPNAAIN